MSGFLKRNKTVNPAGGVNPASSPNVGQYGWTSYDAANVNQLIEYVNMAKEAAISSKDSADYVASKFGELEAFIVYIEGIYEEIGPTFANLDKLYKDVVQKHSEVNTIYVNLLQVYKDTVVEKEAAQEAAANSLQSSVESAASAVVSDTHSKESAESAAKSEASAVLSEKSRQEAAEIAEELRKGQVYRGAWNIEENNSFPPKPDTNSVWDITLKEDSTQFTFAGEVWYWGDRLLYLKDEDKFSQIESGSTVISVNGKGGAVTLVAADVGAVPTSDVSSTGSSGKIPRISGSGVLEIGRYIDFHYTSDVGDNDCRLEVTKNVDGVNHTLNLHSANFNAARQIYENGKRVYSEGNKPTAADVGAVPDTRLVNNKSLNSDITLTAADVGAVKKSGDTMTGALITPGVSFSKAEAFLGDLNGKPLIQTTEQFAAVLVGNETKQTYIVYKDFLNARDKNNVDYRIYHQGFKPTATEIGALPNSGNVPLNGALTIRNPNTTDPLTLVQTFRPSGTFAQGISGFKAGDESTRIWGAGVMSTDAVPDYAYVGLGASPWSSGIQIYSGTDVRCNNGTSKFYHQGFKPTAADVGAVPSTGGMVTGPLLIKNDAGLKFSQYEDLRGITWGMGEDSTTGTLSISKYDKGTLATTPIKLDNYNNVFIRRLTTQGGYTKIQNETGGQTLLELESSDKHARLMWVEPSTGDFNFSISSGGGAELTRLGKWDVAGNFTTYKGVYVNTAPTAWGSYGGAGICPLQSAVNVQNGEWHPMVTSPPYIRHGAGGSDGYLSRWQIGHYRTDGANNGDFVLAMTGDGLLGNTLRYHFRSEGQLSCAGTLDTSHWSVGPGGHLYGSIFGAYGNMVNWCNGSFAPISDERLKRNIKPATKSALSDVSKIKFHSYEWNESTRKPTDIGVLAQEMEAIDTAYSKDIETFKPDGSVDTSVKSLDVTNMLALALKAIQEQQAQIDELKEKLNEFILK